MLTRRTLLGSAIALAASGCLAAGGVVGGIVAAEHSTGAPTELALRDIPADLLELFMRHATPDVPWNLLAAVAWQESRFDPRALSPAGAGGLMQLMPGTAASLGLSAAERFDPVLAVPAAAAYLQAMFDRFGQVSLMLAAYNAGPGNVALHGGIPPFEETRAYVPAVLGQAERYASAGGGVAAGPPLARLESMRGRLADGAAVEVYPAGVADLPQMDPRVLSLVVAIAERWPGVRVSSLKTGHHRYINGTCARGACRESRHWTYRACDLFVVGGQAVRAGSAAPEACWRWLRSLDPAGGRPAAVGSPWGRAAHGGGDPRGHFTDADHRDHFHLDYR